MAKFLLVYHGGGKPASEEEGAKAMAAWRAWFAAMGSAVIDPGNPVGISSTVKSNGSVENNGGSNPASGYSVVEASSLDDALALAKGCPILSSDGSVELAEIFEI